MTKPSMLKAMQQIANAKIEAAIHEGKFEQLEHFGKPIQFEEEYDPNWWIKHKCKQESLNVLPPALQLKRTVEKTLEMIDRMDCKDKARNGLERLNKFIEESNRKIVWGPPSDQQPIDVDSYLAKMEFAPDSN